MRTTTMEWHGNRMARALLTFLFAMAMPAIATLVCAQPTEEEFMEAMDIVKGKSMANTAEWAVSILRDVEDPAVRPMARNAMAMAYLRGTGVARDSAMAAQFFGEAAAAGYANAWHNLGMMEKNAPRGRQDFVKAVEYFEKGAAAGSLMCSYDAGYMYYKGLGCRQDYARAVEYFSRGLDSGNPSCLYMLGLCYRNGFGVEMDEERATDYLERASRANYRFAIEETMRETAEVQPTVRLSETDGDVPESMPEVEAFLDNTTDLGGRYSGCLVTYDWSGGNVVREQRLEVAFSKRADNTYCGTWVQDADTIAFYAEIAPDGTLVFDNTRAMMDDRYTEGRRVEYLFDNAELAMLGNTLTGGLRLYSLTQGEPQRPMYLSLGRQGSVSSTGGERCEMAAWPVAGTSQIELRLTLPHEVRDASVVLVSQNGMYARRYRLGALPAGESRMTISTNLPGGLYVVSMSADGLHGQTAIMLRR